MGAPEENGVLMMQEETEMENGCGCFRSFWSRNSRHINGDYDDQSHLLPETERRQSQELWIVTQLKKLREVSELLAGPKWKNFIRKIGSYFNHNKNNNNNNKIRKDFRYDSYDYTLNFDNGIDDDDEDGLALGFSSRFAPPVQDTKPRL